MKKINFLGLIIFLFAISSCGEVVTEKITTESIEMIEEYPMEGSNTLTGIWKVDLNGLDIEKIDHAKVTAIKIEMIEPTKSDILGECIMQLAAPGTNMQRVAVLNPIPENVNSFEMDIADEQENLLDLLKQSEITFVADINLKEEPATPLSLKTTIEFEIEK